MNVVAVPLARRASRWVMNWAWEVALRESVDSERK